MKASLIENKETDEGKAKKKSLALPKIWLEDPQISNLRIKFQTRGFNFQ